MKRTRTIGDFSAELIHVGVDPETIALWRVADLERHVDRAALLAAADPPEVPYWAYLWSGARVMASVVPRAGSAIELGCGLGLPGLVAARRGARTTFVDRVPAALAFVRASADANGFGAVDACVADFTAPALRGHFDLVLAAEVLYDRTAFASVAETIGRLRKPGGLALVADAGRIDTRSFYDELDARGLAWRSTEHLVREERLPITVRLVEIRDA